jgi:hypothetical protein
MPEQGKGGDDGGASGTVVHAGRHVNGTRVWPAPLRTGPPWRGRSCPDTLIEGMGCLEGGLVMTERSLAAPV